MLVSLNYRSKSILSPLPLQKFYRLDIIYLSQFEEALPHPDINPEEGRK